ncbi:hypothetical protein BJV74DRAFT_780759 [Russula compacta]|nr:hypothetical protein BJV74DRAFT_780759 [Russula compacta]
MSPWITTRLCARLRNATRYASLPRLPPLAVTSTLRATGLLIQPSDNPPSGWLLLSAFVGLPMALWAYKVRSRYTPKGIHIEELSIPSSQPNTVRLSTLLLRRRDVASSSPEHVVIYFQGNAGNPLHRLPVFATLLNAVPSLTILAPAPRSYWTSSAARPTQAGLTADYAADNGVPNSPAPAIHGLVLENAFTSVPDMLRALYPQRWLPYRYLGPFVRDRWDARAAAATTAHTFLRGLACHAMVLVSERDEVVPHRWGGKYSDGAGAVVRPGAGRTREPLGRLVVLEGALHEDAWRHRDWSRVMKQYLEDLRRGLTNHSGPI